MLKIGVILMTFSAFSFGNWFTDLFDSTPTPTISLPIDLSTSGSTVESEIRVKEDGWYDFMIDIPYIKGRDDVKWKEGGISDGAIVRKIIGYNRYEPRTGKLYSKEAYSYMYKDLKEDGIIIDKNYNGDGTSIPIKLVIYTLNDDKSKTLLLEKVYKTKGEGNCSMCRVITEIHLKKGKYVIRLENMDFIKEMKRRKANIKLGRAYHGK